MDYHMATASASLNESTSQVQESSTYTSTCSTTEYSTVQCSVVRAVYALKNTTETIKVAETRALCNTRRSPANHKTERVLKAIYMSSLRYGSLYRMI